MTKITLAHSDLTNTIYAIVGKEKIDITEQAVAEVRAIKSLEQESEIKEIEKEIRKNLDNLTTYRLPNSDTDLVTLISVKRVLNLVFRGCRDIDSEVENG